MRRPTRGTAGRPTYAFILVTIAAGLTSFYSWRLVFMTFFGPAHWASSFTKRLPTIMPMPMRMMIIHTIMTLVGMMRTGIMPILSIHMNRLS